MGACRSGSRGSTRGSGGLLGGRDAHRSDATRRFPRTTVRRGARKTASIVALCVRRTSRGRRVAVVAPTGDAERRSVVATRGGLTGTGDKSRTAKASQRGRLTNSPRATVATAYYWTNASVTTANPDVVFYYNSLDVDEVPPPPRSPRGQRTRTPAGLSFELPSSTAGSSASTPRSPEPAVTA